MPDSTPTTAPPFELPLFSELALDKSLLNTLTKQKLIRATAVQAKTIPLALQQKDLMVSAQTGSGKTMAYLLPALQHFLTTPDQNTHGTRALILVPTRELATQVQKHCALLTGKNGIKSTAIIGGNDFKFQAALLRKNPEIVIATPGRLLDLMNNGKISFTSLEILVLDEADRMLDMGFSEDVLDIVGRCNKQRQTLLFSATLHHKGLTKIIDQLVVTPEIVSIGTIQEKHEDIQQQVILADHKAHKEKLVSWLVSNEPFKKALVFTNTRIQADQLGRLLRYQKIRAGVLHGDMKQSDRKKTLGLFNQGVINVLIASDVAARGLDIKSVDLVINVSIPRNSDDYIHRIGRTGRAGQKGLAISLVDPEQWNSMISTERYLKVEFEQRAIKGLKASFKGPKKQKSSGKAVGVKTKKTTNEKKTIKKKSSKAKVFTGKSGGKVIDGFAPLKKK